MSCSFKFRLVNRELQAFRKMENTEEETCIWTSLTFIYFKKFPNIHLISTESRKPMNTQINLIIFRSSRPVKEFCKGDVLSLLPATLLKKRLWHRCFPVNFVKFLTTSFFIEHLGWLLLNLIILKKQSKISKESLNGTLLKVVSGTFLRK